MRRTRPILLALGVLLVLMGLLWIGQGLGYVNWPRSSFMLAQREWAVRGALTAVVGLGLIVFARRR